MVRLGQYDGKERKKCSEEKCLFVDSRNRAKPKWLHNPSEISIDNLKKARRETSRHFKKYIYICKVTLRKFELSKIQLLCLMGLFLTV